MRIREITQPVYDGKYLPNTTSKEELHLLQILLNKKASKNDRLFLVGRLKFIGYSVEQTKEVIRNLNAWEGYNDDITGRWITFVYKIQGRNQKANIDCNPILPVSPLITWEELRQIFFSKTLPIAKMNVPNDPFNAALYYHNMGFHTLPKSDKGKYPLISWRKYGDVKPTLSEIKKWDFTYGVCIITTKHYCFLDIDEPGKVEYQGHLEQTPRGGHHLYALGEVPNKKATGKGEIKGYGSLIVAYPSAGYKAIL
jgi:hypothetical protein